MQIGQYCTPELAATLLSVLETRDPDAFRKIWNELIVEQRKELRLLMKEKPAAVKGFVPLSAKWCP